jgi:hypothetical protein
MQVHLSSLRIQKFHIESMNKYYGFERIEEMSIRVFAP